MRKFIAFCFAALLGVSVIQGANIDGSRFASEGNVIYFGTKSLPDTSQTVEVFGVWLFLKHSFFLHSDTTEVGTTTVRLQHSLDGAHWADIDTLVVAVNDFTGCFDYAYLPASKYFRVVASGDSTANANNEITNWMKIGSR